MSTSLLLWQGVRSILGRGLGSRSRPDDVPSGLGRWGLHEFVEPQLRLLLAKHLGVGVEQLVLGVSLREDLAADSLDLVEIALLVERRFGVSLSDGLLDGVQSYGELVDVTIGLLMARAADEKASGEYLPHSRPWLGRGAEHRFAPLAEQDAPLTLTIEREERTTVGVRGARAQARLGRRAAEPIRTETAA